MPPAFLQVAIPVLYVYDEGTLPEAPPGFDMSLLPVISRALKEHANTSRVTVITGAPTSSEELGRAYTNLGLQFASIKKASPEAGNLLVAEFVADHFDLEAVLDHLQRIRDERQRELAESVEAHRRRTGRTDEDEEGDDASPEDDAEVEMAPEDETAQADDAADDEEALEADDEAADEGAPPRRGRGSRGGLGGDESRSA
jgi:hypothetical protein